MSLEVFPPCLVHEIIDIALFSSTLNIWQNSPGKTAGLVVFFVKRFWNVNFMSFIDIQQLRCFLKWFLLGRVLVIGICDIVLYDKKFLFRLLSSPNPWNFRSVESDKSVFFMLMSGFGKASKGAGWLPPPATSRKRGGASRSISHQRPMI